MPRPSGTRRRQAQDDRRRGNDQQQEGPEAQDALLACFHKGKEGKHRMIRRQFIDHGGFQAHRAVERFRIDGPDPGEKRHKAEQHQGRADHRRRHIPPAFRTARLRRHRLSHAITSEFNLKKCF